MAKYLAAIYSSERKANMKKRNGYQANLNGVAKSTKMKTSRSVKMREMKKACGVSAGENRRNEISLNGVVAEIN